MRRFLTPIRRWLANRPQLRRRLTVIVYRFPSLDMRLRRLLQAGERRASTHSVDAEHLSASTRLVMTRIRGRMSKA